MCILEKIPLLVSLHRANLTLKNPDFRVRKPGLIKKADRRAVSGERATFPVIRWVRSLGRLRYPLDGT